jgi:hypothetical protein
MSRNFTGTTAFRWNRGAGVVLMMNAMDDETTLDGLRTLNIDAQENTHDQVISHITIHEASGSEISGTGFPKCWHWQVCPMRLCT